MKQFSLLRKERISRRTEVQAVFDKGRSLANASLKLFYLRNGLAFPRFAVLINKRFGNAVERNRAKRQVRELFRTSKDLLPAGLDMIFSLRQEFKILDFEEKKKRFLDLVSRIQQI
jgi:ribonuclease P protein component